VAGTNINPVDLEKRARCLLSIAALVMDEEAHDFSDSAPHDPMLW
jgi:hypothetical protein